MALEDMFVSLQSRMYEFTKEKDLNRFTNILKKIQGIFERKNLKYAFFDIYIIVFKVLKAVLSNITN